MQNIEVERFDTTIQFPDSYSDEQINDAIINKVIPQLEEEEEERRKAEAERRKDETGLLEAFSTSLSRGIDKLLRFLVMHCQPLPPTLLALTIIGTVSFRNTKRAWSALNASLLRSPHLP